MLKSLRLQPLLAKIAVGYMAKIVVISGIAYVGICEWKETKAREMEVRMINRKKHEINDICCSSVKRVELFQKDSGTY